MIGEASDGLRHAAVMETLVLARGSGPVEPIVDLPHQWCIVAAAQVGVFRYHFDIISESYTVLLKMLAMYARDYY
jgi:hypothetical protein